jgi:TolA-binding protein
MRQHMRNFILTGLLAGVAAMPIPAIAADPAPVESRVDRLEKEMRAVQRKVFPGGAPVQPDMTTAAPETNLTPSSSPVSDLIARVTSLETQLATLTGQVEQNSYRLKQLEDRFNALKAEAAPEVSAAPASTTAPMAAPAVQAPRTAAVAPAAPAKAAPAAPSDARKAAVAAIEIPATGDAANDAYVYGFRLWGAKFYPEAQVQLESTVQKYGNGSIGSRAQNLLGRAYLDDGKPATAVKILYDNYQKRPNGDRAAQSLAYLGEALLQLKKPAEACKVYRQLESDYSADLTSDLRSMMEKGRTRAKCGA